MAEPLGVIAAGHPVCAQAGAEAMRRGGNAVDGALAAMLSSFACEPLLTSLGAGGYMLVVEPGEPPVLLDFFVEAPGRGAEPSARAELMPVSVSFGDAVQVFNIGPASVGTYGMAAGVCEASSRFGRIPLADLAGPAAKLAREVIELNAAQADVVESLAGVVTSTPECAARFARA
ncbi:MAG: gamma-glutamyltransferase, partial [Solirubrobacterales bacterium]|nr:gamma-glutamyltransferase [Solirubrobacterales bacterium]